MQKQQIYLLKDLNKLDINFIKKTQYFWYDVEIPESDLSNLKILTKYINISYCRTLQQLQSKASQQSFSNIITSPNKFYLINSKPSLINSHFIIYGQIINQPNIIIYDTSFPSIVQKIITKQIHQFQFSQNIPNFALILDRETQILEKYRKCVYSLQLSNHFNNGLSDFIKLAEFLFPKQLTLKNFKQNYKSQDVLKWYNGVYKSCLNQMIRLSINPTQSAYVRLIFSDLYKKILQKYQQFKNQQKFVVYRSIQNSEAIIQFLKEHEGQMVEILGFLQLTKYKNKINTKKILQIQIIPSKCPQFQVGYIDLQKISIQSPYYQIIFNVWSVFEIISVLQTQQITTVKLKHGEFSSLWTKQKKTKLDLNYLKTYQSAAIKLKQTIKTQGDALSQCGFYKQSIDFNIAYIQKFCKQNSTQKARRFYQIGKSNKYLGKIVDAIDNNIICLNIQKQVLGEIHISCGTSYGNIGELFSQKGDYQKAIQNYQKSLQIFNTCLGQVHILTAAVNFNLGNAYKKIKEYGKSIQFYMRGIQIQETIVGKNHSSITKCYIQLAQCFELINEYQRAINYYEIALSIQIRSFGKFHTSLSFLYRKLGNLNKMNGKLQIAINWYECQLEIYDKNKNENSLQRAHVNYDIGCIYEANRKYNDGLWYFMNAYKIYNSISGVNASSTLKTLASIRRCEKNR